MKIDSDDILKQDFATKFFGFDKREVRVFLNVVANVYEELINENTLLRKQLTAIDAKETEFITKDDLKKFISTLQWIKEKEIEKAEQEAALIIKEAQLKAGAMIREAESEVEKRKITLSEIKGQHRSFERKMKEQIESFLSSVREGENGEVSLGTFSENGLSSSES
jgi:cell division initiation protein